MSKLYKELNSKDFHQNNIKCGQHAILYIYDSYFILYNDNDLSSCWVFLSNNFKKSLAVLGKCELQIISGSIKLNGVNFCSPFQEKIYSPLCHSKITIQSSDNSLMNNFNLEDIISLLNTNNEFNEEDIVILKKALSDKKSISSINNWNALKLSSFFCLTINDIVLFKEYKKLFDVDLDFPFASKLKFSLTLEEFPSYNITSEMQKLLNEIVQSSLVKENLSVVLAGPKNVGKSSFLKTIMNRLLSEGHQEICIIDGDPGQSEFSPCGTLSLTVTSKPLFGPPFINQFSPNVKIVEQYFLGLTSPNDDPKLYCRSFERLYHSYLSLCNGKKRIPLIINTMGWLQGVGMLLLAFKILLINPTHIVQLKKGKANQDLVDISPDLLFKISETEGSLFTNLRHMITSEISILKSPVSQNPNLGLPMNPQSHRELMMIAYLFNQTENRPLCFSDVFPSDYSWNPITRLRCRIPEMLKIAHPLSRLVHSHIDDKNDDNHDNAFVQLKLAYSEIEDLDQLDSLFECFTLQWVGLCKPAVLTSYQSVIEKSFYDNCKRNEMNLMQCFGMGLISHIRKEECEIDLLTGASRSLLNSCCLVKGKIYPPESLFLYQREVICKRNNNNLPFISPIITVGVGRTAIATRKSLPKIRRHVHN